MSVIDSVLDAEEDTIQLYHNLISASADADDPITEDLAATILSDEEAHRTEFRGFRREYKQVDRGNN